MNEKTAPQQRFSSFICEGILDTLCNNKMKFELIFSLKLVL